MQITKFEVEINPIPTRDIMGMLRRWATEIEKETGAFVEMTLSNENNSFRKGETYHDTAGNNTWEIPSRHTYTLSGYCIPDKNPDVNKWKLAVLKVMDEYRKAGDYWFGQDKTRLDVIFTDKNGIDLQTLKNDKSLEECTEDIKGILRRQEIEDMFK